MTDVDIQTSTDVRTLETLSLSFKEKHCERPYFVRSTGQYVRCQSSDPSVCRKCASLRSLDKKRIIGSGCNASALDGITEEMLLPFRFYFVTFTAPSFGRIKDGAPVDAKRYEYKAQVNWNQKSRDLFHATTRSLERRLPESEWVFVREWQKRGAIHFHGIVRTPEWEDQNEVIAELRALKGVESRGITWGRQMDIQSLTSERTNTVRYMSKVVAYTSKHQSGKRGLLPERVASFYSRLDSHAQQLTCNRSGCTAEKQCKGRTHRTHGYAGQMLSKSSRWSFTELTYGELRAQRVAFAQKNLKTNNQAELSLAADLAKAAYDEAFIGMTSPAAGASRLQRTLDASLRSTEQQSSATTNAS